MNPTDEEQPRVTTTDDARQGVTGHNVRWVLLIGILGLIASYLIFLLPA